MTTPFAIGDELLAEKLNDLEMTFTVQVFPSTGTWIKPDGLSRLWVRVQGAGGGGGGVAATSAVQLASAGGGGGGGYAEKLFLASALANTETVDIGAAGLAGASGANPGGTGGTTNFATGKAYLVAAAGGIGGGGGVAAGGFLNSFGGGGGNASGGDININGGVGGTGLVLSTTAVYVNNPGGASRMSGSAPSIGSSGSGTVGLAYGGGASGAFNNVSQGARPGAAGATGLVIVWNCF